MGMGVIPLERNMAPSNRHTHETNSCLQSLPSYRSTKSVTKLFPCVKQLGEIHLEAGKDTTGAIAKQAAHPNPRSVASAEKMGDFVIASAIKV